MQTRSAKKVWDYDVKRLLRRKNGAEYVCNGGWTRDPSKATSFSNVLEAAQACVRRDLRDVELTLRVEPRACDVFCTGLA